MEFRRLRFLLYQNQQRADIALVRDFKAAFGPRPRGRRRLGSPSQSGSRSCTTVSHLWNRDENIVRNIRMVVQAALAGKARPAHLLPEVPKPETAAATRDVKPCDSSTTASSVSHFT